MSTLDYSDADSELTRLMAEDAAAMAAAIPTDDKLHTVSALAYKLLQLRAEVATQEQKLEEAKAKLAKVEEIELPEAMDAARLPSITLEDGSKVTVEDEYYANIPSADTDNPALAARRAAVFKWMRDNGHAPLIKNEIKTVFSRGEDEQAQRVINGLNKAGIPFRQTESVHHSTLKAWVKEQVERVLPEGAAPFPRDTFGVHHKRVADVKPAKQSRKSRR